LRQPAWSSFDHGASGFKLDKPQLLAFILAARFKKPVPIIAGILCHAGEPWLGGCAGRLLAGRDGGKTQIVTVALAAHYGAPLMVIAGTTLGMLLADVPAVFLATGLPTIFQVDKLFQ
jgi:putative Ca2+/H+ antiporter (TMEM165/GDT1 family)